MGIIKNQSLIIDNDILILRGPYDTVVKQFDTLVSERRKYGKSASSLGMYTPNKLGLSDAEVSSIVSYAIDYQGNGYFLAIATMCSNGDVASMRRFLEYVRLRGY